MTKLVQYPEREIEWVAALVMFGFGLALAHPDRTLIVHGYHVMNQVGLSEQMYAFLFTAIGFLRIVSLKINGRMKWTPYARLIGAGVSAVIYTILALFFALAFWDETPANTAAITYGIFGCVDVKNSRRIRSDVYVAKRFTG